MTRKQRGKAIAYAMDNYPEYPILVNLKYSYQDIKRPLNKDEVREFTRICDQIENLLKQALWFV